MDKGISGLDQLQRTIRGFNHMDTTDPEQAKRYDSAIPEKRRAKRSD